MLLTVNAIWSNSNFASEALRNIFDFSWYFRPLTAGYFLLVYHFLKGYPLLLYILIIIVNMTAMLFWGVLFNYIFRNERDNSGIFINVFIFPLFFFIFTPFWNMFQYISLAEKFIFFFSPIAIYSMKRYLDTEKIKFFLFSFFSLLFLICSKPSGVYLVLCFLVYSVLAMIVNRDKRGVNFLIFIVNILLLLAYYFFTLKYQSYGYASKYNLNLLSLAHNFLNASFIIKLLFVIAVLIVFNQIWVKKRISFSAVIPLGFLCYIAILLPWGSEALVAYHISPTTPYIMGMFFPLYSYFNEKSRQVSPIVNCLLLFLVFSAFFYVISPRISKMADIKKTVNFLKSSSKSYPEPEFFLPPPFMESAHSLTILSGMKVNYIDSGILSFSLLGNGNNFLILNDQAPSVVLSDIGLGDIIYQNNSWRIYRINRGEAPQEKFTTEFRRNFVDDLKDLLKKPLLIKN